jgi:hypothetical protein
MIKRFSRRASASNSKVAHNARDTRNMNWGAVDITELEARYRQLEAAARHVTDVQAIERLQRTYGYYLDNHMYEEVVELFSRDAEFELVDTGTYKGKDGIARFLGSMAHGSPEESRKRLSLHMQLQGVVDVDDRGTTAQGRWQCLILIGAWAKSFGDASTGPTLPPTIGQGVYENQYVKEEEVWRISHLKYSTTFWSESFSHAAPQPDVVASISDTTYPTGYFLPHHFGNPVSRRP